MATYVAQPQASRAGLITTIVVFVVLAILMSVMFFVRDSDLRKTQLEYDAFQKKYADAVTAADLPSPEYGDAKTKAKEVATRTHQPYSVYDLVSQQGKDLATVVTGQEMQPSDAAERARFTTEQNNGNLVKYGNAADLKVAPGGSLVDTAGKWTAIADKLIGQREDLKGQLDASKKAMDAAAAAHVAALADKDKQIADAKADIAKAQEQIAALQKTQGENLTTVKTGADQSIATLNTQMTAVQAQAAQLTANLATLTKDRDNLLRVLKRFKANNDPKEDIIRVPDGVVINVSGTDCFINLGEGDQVSKGMTFEVYDPIKGIPPLGNGTSTPDRPAPRGAAGGAATPVSVAAAGRKADKYEFEMPKGKGSIEVIAVGPGHQSTCRIVHLEEGQQITQGDLIANLVYDRNIKYNFVVYGDFDLSGSNNVNSRANDAPVIRRLIEQWGGAVQPIADPAKPADAVTADTDFVIVGREPVVPNFTPEEIGDPNNAAIADRAKAKMAAYQAVLGRASDLGIPVMNQNRFLYYTGYYDQAKR